MFIRPSVCLLSVCQYLPACLPVSLSEGPGEKPSSIELTVEILDSNSVVFLQVDVTQLTRSVPWEHYRSFYRAVVQT